MKLSWKCSYLGLSVDVAISFQIQWLKEDEMKKITAMSSKYSMQEKTDNS